MKVRHWGDLVDKNYSLTECEKTEFIFSALVKTWLELGSESTYEFKLNNGIMTIDSKGLCLVFLRSSGSIYFTLTFTFSKQGTVQVQLTPYRYRRPNFADSIVLELAERIDYETFVSQLDKKHIEVLRSDCDYDVFKEYENWSEVFISHLTSELSEYVKEIESTQRHNREIKDVELELSYGFARLTRMYLHFLMDSQKGKVSSEDKAIDTDLSKLFISTQRLAFQTKFDELDSYTFEVRPQGYGYGHLGYFSLADEQKYLSTFGVRLGDFNYKEGSIMVSYISKEHQLLFLEELESCLVSLGLWSEYFIPIQAFQK